MLNINYTSVTTYLISGKGPSSSEKIVDTVKNIWGSVKSGKFLDVNERPLLFSKMSVVNVVSSIFSRIYYLLFINIICCEFKRVLTLSSLGKRRIYADSFQEQGNGENIYPLEEGIKRGVEKSEH